MSGIWGQVIGTALLLVLEYWMGKRKEKDPTKAGSVMEACAKPFKKKSCEQCQKDEI